MSRPTLIPVLFSLVSVLACGGPGAPAVDRPTSELDVVLRARVPSGMPDTGSVIAFAWGPEDDGIAEDISRFVEVLGRVQVSRGVRAEAGVIEVPVRLPTRPATVRVIYDTTGLGLEAMFGPAPGLALASVAVPAAGSPPELELVGEPFREPEERCAGEREELVVLDVPSTRTPDDAGERRLCVYLPPSYASAPDRRYPVVFAYPGFSGWHANGNAWRQRALFDQASEGSGVEVLVVGVGTRTPEGSSYLQRSDRFGDWDAYLVERVVAEIDARYRTVPRRGTFGHSTGGWQAIATATRHPGVFHVVAASSPDGPDLDAWLLDEHGEVRRGWLDWIRAEDALGGRGQFVSYAAAWSPDPTESRGFRWPVDLETGALLPEVYASWRAASPAADLGTDEGLARARRLSGALLITTGRADEFALFEPSERYVRALEGAGIDVRWLPTEFGHFGSDVERMMPLVEFLLAGLAEPAIEPR